MKSGLRQIDPCCRHHEYNESEDRRTTAAVADFCSCCSSKVTEQQSRINDSDPLGHLIPPPTAASLREIRTVTLSENLMQHSDPRKLVFLQAPTNDQSENRIFIHSQRPAYCFRTSSSSSHKDQNVSINVLTQLRRKSVAC